MKRVSRSQSLRLAIIAIAVNTSAVWAASLPAARPEQAQPKSDVSRWTAGSASLVPLPAAEMEANHAAAIDAPDDNAGGATTKTVDDVAFVKQATESGRKEIDSARLALPQLKQPELKRMAEMLVTDHSGANVRLSKIAEAKGWPIPAPQPAPPPPSGTASSDFDSKWTSEMIAGHERSAALYRAQAQSGEDQDLREYARETLPTIERHLAELRRLQK